MNEYSVLYYKCDIGYILDTLKPTSFCVKGEWKPKIKCESMYMYDNCVKTFFLLVCIIILFSRRFLSKLKIDYC